MDHVKVVVVGAGLGGLAAAIMVARGGWPVVVVERAPVAGGKLGVVTLDGVEVDTGPSVLTLPEVLDELLQAAGMSVAADLPLRRPSPAFRYLYPDGLTLDLFTDRAATLAAVDAALGADARRQLTTFLDHAARIWEASEVPFLRGERPGWATLGRLPLSAWPGLVAIDPFRTMDEAITRLVTEPHLRALLQRYATYNGSDVRRAPAALNCIAHVELGLGGFGVEGGVVRIARVLEQAAARLGVEFRFGDGVAGIEIAGGRVTGVTLDSGARLDATAVVWNGEIAALSSVAPDLGLPSAAPDSLSGWTAIARVPRRTGADARVAHTVLFADPYREEFAALFDAGSVPESPTVYLCAPEASFGRTGWDEEEPLFLMVNAPPGARESNAEIETRVRRRLGPVGLLGDGDPIVWVRGPTELAQRFPGSGGSLYGAASHGPLAPFKRHPQRVPGPVGLYAAGGSVHPGGGMPLALLSGITAGRLLLADAGGDRRRRPN